ALLEAGVAEYALGVIVADLTVLHGKRAHRAHLHALTAIHALVDGFGIMAIQAVEVAALQEDRGAVARPVHRTERDDLVYQRFHISAPGGPERGSCGWRQGPGRWCSAARCDPRPASRSQNA